MIRINLTPHLLSAHHRKVECIRRTNERRRDKKRAWREAHLEHISAWGKRYRARDEVREKDRARSVALRSERPEHVRAIQRASAKRHPETALHSLWRRRAREAGAPGRGVTRVDWETIKEVHGHRCAYCLRAGMKLTIDHVTALFVDGAHDPDNIVPACESCNKRKRDRGVLYLIGRVA